MATNFTKFTSGVNLKPNASSVAVNEGDLAFRDDVKKLELHNGTAADLVVGEVGTATLTNKTIDASLNTLSNIANSAISATAAIAYSKLNLAGSIQGTDLASGFSVPYSNLNLTNSIVNSDINTAAAIAYSKLALSNSIVNADINSAAAIAYSKLALTASIVNADVSPTAAIAYSKLNLATSITNADIATTAAIARTKLASGTANQVVINDGTGVLSSEAFLAKVRGGTAQDNTNLTFPATGVLATLAGTETFSNKTFSDAPTFAQIATPTNPTTGFNKIYPKADGSFYTLDSLGNEVQVGANSGATNYITNPSGKNNLNGATTYANGTAVPTTGSGGTPTLTLTRNTASPITAGGNYLVTLGALGNGVAIPFTINVTDQSEVLSLLADYSIASGTYTDGLLSFYIYDVTNGALIYPTGSQLLNKIGNGVGFKTTFQTAPNSTSYKLLIHQTASGSATVNFANLSVSPQTLSSGPVMTDWTAFTPSGSFTTNASYSGTMRRVGDSVEVSIRMTMSGATNSTVLLLNLPAGLSIDTSKVPADASYPLGRGVMLRAGVAYYDMPVVYYGTTSVGVNFNNISGATSSAYEQQVSNTSPVTWGTGDVFDFTYKVPILGWSSNTLVSSDAAVSEITALYKGNNSGQSLTGNVSPIQWGTKEFDNTGTVTTVNGGLQFQASVSGNYQFSLQFYNNSSTASDTYAWINGANTGTVVVRGGSAPAVYQGSRTYHLNAGDKIQFIPQYNISTAGNGAYDYFNVSRVSSPQQIATSESIIASYYSSDGASPSSSGGIINYQGKVRDTHNAVTTGAGTWAFTAPISGTYSYAASYYNGNSGQVAILASKNGTSFEVSYCSPSGSSTLKVCGLIYLAAGEKLNFTASGYSGALATGASQNTCYIARIGN